MKGHMQMPIYSPLTLQNFRRVAPAWVPFLEGEFRKMYMRGLRKFLTDQKRSGMKVCPSEKNKFASLAAAPPCRVKVMIVGHDPYIQGEADGLAFSSLPNFKRPYALSRIITAINADLGCSTINRRNRKGGCSLEFWAKQGVLLLNSVLTVKHGGPSGAHDGQGWEEFTDRIIKIVNNKRSPVVFILWGLPARRKINMITNKKHKILCAPHPSSRRENAKVFTNCRHFSTSNQFLSKHYGPTAEINWSNVRWFP